MEGQTVLIDLYGCIKAVVPHHDVFVRSKNKMETKCEITLENMRRCEDNSLGDTTREFDLDAIYNLPPPVLAVFTSLRIALFQQQPTPSSTNHSCIIIDPDIGQREDYEEEFSKAGDKRKLLPTPSKQPLHQEAKDHAKKTASRLNTVNLHEYQVQTRFVFPPTLLFCFNMLYKCSYILRLYTLQQQALYCNAWICRFPTYNSCWWYKGCLTCRKELKQKEDTNQLSCSRHNVQTPLPCYRVYMTIENDTNQATVVLMRRQAEQLFGSKCQDLVNNSMYSTKQTVPKEIQRTIGENYLTQKK
ncbi:putative nucleic acid-binding protein [Rosa chinensis]|uniref:Putative nucleic acid-binding protein n=1 Tax=Rosa chinensis TaxID=74649 RepID=A0A2P6S643_ROSCH|nr:putative nucleic acid-binding protein [Rosa chinensis]